MFGKLILLLFAALAVVFILICLAAYYLLSNQYGTVSLVAPAVIFLLIVTYTVFRYSRKDVLSVLCLLGVPFAYLGAINDLNSSEFSRYIFIVIGIIINYFVLFGVINFTHRAVSGMFSMLFR